ncbi:speckle-type POZ protein-like [Aphidius gifuensis]|uniref:speckle-type POZ protein-like n=1 Tax=Aphidius gifuensis TaxID=684658 RepID=UPI001CDC72E5|nr:speckle-type POZ protein-like [Aphidius gifuensis]
MSVLAGAGDVTNVTAVTGIECCEFTYEWTIKNFSQWARRVIKSPIFSSNYGDFEDKWILGIYSDLMYSAGGTILVYAYLNLQSFNNTSQLQTKCKISVNNIQEITNEYEFRQFPETTEWVSCAYDLSNPNRYLPDGDLKVCYLMPTAGGYINISVYLNLQSFNNTSQLQTSCRISINDINETTKEFSVNFSKFPTITKWISCFYNVSNPNQYAANGDLKVCCTIRMSKKPTNNSNGISTFNATPKLGVDLKKLLLNEESADVTIQVGQKSFHAIKGILAVRSPVFAAMFNHKEFKENEKNEVVIEDIDEDVFEEFLHYIYTDESPNIDKMPMELLAVAEKYQVDCLKNICEGVTCRKIDFENVASKFVFSDRYNLEKLNLKCLEFMKRNLRDVMANKTFQAYKKKYPEIFVGVLEELLLSANSVNYN